MLGPLLDEGHVQPGQSEVRPMDAPCAPAPTNAILGLAFDFRAIPTRPGVVSSEPPLTLGIRMIQREFPHIGHSPRIPQNNAPQAAVPRRVGRVDCFENNARKAKPSSSPKAIAPPCRWEAAGGPSANERSNWGRSLCPAQAGMCESSSGETQPFQVTITQRRI